LPEEKTLLSTIENIAFQLEENEIEAPALFIFGPVLHSDFVALKNQVNLDYVQA
jgi:precorrin-4 methylase